MPSVRKSGSALPPGMDAPVRLRYRASFSEAYNLFQTVADHYRELTPADFDICCEYSLEGSGICADSTKASPISHCKLPAGAALFELAKYFLEGLSPVDKNIENGRSLLKKAYDFHCEEALFYDFNLFGGNYNTYEYQDDIRELYSFRIGQYGRVCDINPSKETYLRLIQMYEKGYPGDNAERRLDFAKKRRRSIKNGSVKIALPLLCL